MPGVKIVTQPYLLMEAVELLYLFMNNDSFHNTRRNFFLKYSEQLSEAEREYYETLFRTLEEILTEGTKGLDREDPELQYYFQKFQWGTARDTVCLAKIVLYSFLQGGPAEFDESIKACRERYYICASDNFSHYKIQGISHSGLDFVRCGGEETQSLFAQVDQLFLPEASKWNIYKILMEYETHLNALQEQLRPVAARLQQILQRHDALFQKAIDSWRSYFAHHGLRDFKQSVLGFDMGTAQDATWEETVCFWRIGCTRVDLWQDEEAETANIGVVVRLDTSTKPSGKVMEDVSNILKLLSDKSRFEILQRLSQREYYGLELAGEMKLTSGTISKHLNVLFSYGLLNLRRVDNRIYYRTDEESVRHFLQQVGEQLFSKHEDP